MYIDKNTIDYVNHYAERIFPDFYAELKRIDDKYRGQGKFAGEEHQKERHTLIKDNSLILEIETRMLDSLRTERLKELGNVDNGKIIIHQKDGHCVYWTKYLRKYDATFKPKTNPYKLLLYLSQNPGKSFSVSELAIHLNPQRQEANSVDDRRIRDTVQTIRKSLKLNKDDDFFLVDRKSFGLNCESELKP